MQDITAGLLEDQYRRQDKMMMTMMWEKNKLKKYSGQLGLGF